MVNKMTLDMKVSVVLKRIFVFSNFFYNSVDLLLADICCQLSFCIEA